MLSKTDAILAGKRAIEARYGPWTAHNIRLDDEIYTISDNPNGNDLALRRVLQIIADQTGVPLDRLRVLDLACLEGLYAIELGLQGATVVAIEGREQSIAKARFVGETLGLSKVEFVQDDVRNLSRATYGSFDVVLCLGLLYHLDAPDVVVQLERIAEVCTGVAIIDTHISLAPERSFEYRGQRYWGRIYSEHAPHSSDEQRRRSLWASLDNVNSFWLTRPSLYNALADAGFSTVYECQIPALPHQPYDRLTLVARKGEARILRSSPLANDLAPRWAERRRQYLRPIQAIHYDLGVRYGRQLPPTVKLALKRLLWTIKGYRGWTGREERENE